MSVPCTVDSRYTRIERVNKTNLFAALVVVVRRGQHWRGSALSETQSQAVANALSLIYGVDGDVIGCSGAWYEDDSGAHARVSVGLTVAGCTVQATARQDASPQDALISAVHMAYKRAIRTLRTASRDSAREQSCTGSPQYSDIATEAAA